MAFCKCHEGARAAKTNLAVSSTEFCQSTFDESYIEARLSSGSCHRAMILPR